LHGLLKYLGRKDTKNKRKRNQKVTEKGSLKKTSFHARIGIGLIVKGTSCKDREENQGNTLIHNEKTEKPLEGKARRTQGLQHKEYGGGEGP